jgi:putative peptidoglycan lipid II flippase
MPSFVKSTSVVALSTLASRVLGLVRDLLFASYFGATGTTDAFWVAFRIPNLFRRLVAEGALTVSFIPVYTDYLVNRGKDEAMEVAVRTFTFLLVIVLLVTTAGVAFSPVLVKLIGWGFKESTIISLAVDLNRMMFPYLIFVSLVAFSMGYLNSHGHFFAPAFAPVLLNVGFITGIALFSRLFTTPLYGVALGVVAGGVLQVILQVPFLIKKGFKITLVFDLKHPGIQKIFTLLGPALFGIAVYQINIVMSTILASQLQKGSISWLYYTDRLTEMVLGVFIISIGNVILPGMSRVSAANDFSALKEMYRKALRASLFLALPAAAALISVGAPIISVLFMRNAFSVHDMMMTNRSLFYASMGIVPVAMLRVTAPVFYSLKDTRTPVIGAAIAFLLNISLGYLLMHTSLEHGGLSLANVIAVSMQVIFLFIMLEKKIGRLDLHVMVRFIATIAGAAALMVVVIVNISSRVDWIEGGLVSRILWLGAIVFSGIGVYGLAAYILRVDEVHFVVGTIRRKISGG